MLYTRSAGYLLGNRESRNLLSLLNLAFSADDRWWHGFLKSYFCLYLAGDSLAWGGLFPPAAAPSSSKTTKKPNLCWCGKTNKQKKVPWHVNASLARVAPLSWARGEEFHLQKPHDEMWCSDSWGAVWWLALNPAEYGVWAVPEHEAWEEYATVPPLIF